MTDGQHTSLTDLLEGGKFHAGLYNLLVKRWKVPNDGDDSPDSPTTQTSRAEVDLSVGLSTESGRMLTQILFTLSLLQLSRFDRLAPLVMLGQGKVSVIHLLFLLTSCEFKEGLGELCGFVGEMPSAGYPYFVRLPPLFCQQTSHSGESIGKISMHTSLP